MRLAEQSLFSLDEVLSNIDRLNQRVASYLDQLEMDMLFEDIAKLHQAQAIDRALDQGDERLFKCLVRGEIHYDISTDNA